MHHSLVFVGSDVTNNDQVRHSLFLSLLEGIVSETSGIDFPG